MSRDVNAELPIFTYLPNESVASTECRSFGNTTNGWNSDFKKLFKLLGKNIFLNGR
jgi:hypothetical protein